jgi:hypothetical protein
MAPPLMSQQQQLLLQQGAAGTCSNSIQNGEQSAQLDSLHRMQINTVSVSGFALLFGAAMTASCGPKQSKPAV